MATATAITASIGVGKQWGSQSARNTTVLGEFQRALKNGRDHASLSHTSLRCRRGVVVSRATPVVMFMSKARARHDEASDAICLAPPWLLSLDQIGERPDSGSEAKPTLSFPPCVIPVVAKARRGERRTAWIWFSGHKRRRRRSAGTADAGRIRNPDHYGRAEPTSGKIIVREEIEHIVDGLQQAGPVSRFDSSLVMQGGETQGGQALSMLPRSPFFPAAPVAAVPSPFAR
ncbi:hypothetical protein OQA88_982 [Cercophora sp. LCS_1]